MSDLAFAIRGTATSEMTPKEFLCGLHDLVSEAIASEHGHRVFRARHEGRYQEILLALLAHDDALRTRLRFQKNLSASDAR